MRGSGSNNIAVVVPTITNNFFACLVDSVERECRKHQYKTLITQTYREKQNEEEAMSLLSMHHADGIILCSIENEWEMLKSYLSYGKLIACNEYNEDQSVSMIRAKQYEGFYKATEYLLSQEKRGIAYCTGTKTLTLQPLATFLQIPLTTIRQPVQEEGKLAARDNSRTPMQWNTEKNAGFTDGEPWIAVNDNYKTINAEAAVKDPELVFFYYKKLVQLRHEVPVITDGVYKLLDADNEKVYTYLRKNEDETLLVICNFTKETIDYPVGDFVEATQGTLLISNYDDAPQQYADAIELKPYGAYVYEIK